MSHHQSQFNPIPDPRKKSNNQSYNLSINSYHPMTHSMLYASIAPPSVFRSLHKRSAKRLDKCSRNHSPHHYRYVISPDPTSPSSLSYPSLRGSPSYRNSAGPYGVSPNPQYNYRSPPRLNPNPTPHPHANPHPNAMAVTTRRGPSASVTSRRSPSASASAGSNASYRSTASILSAASTTSTLSSLAHHHRPRYSYCGSSPLGSLPETDCGGGYPLMNTVDISEAEQKYNYYYNLLDFMRHPQQYNRIAYDGLCILSYYFLH